MLSGSNWFDPCVNAHQYYVNYCYHVHPQNMNQLRCNINHLQSWTPFAHWNGLLRDVVTSNGVGGTSADPWTQEARSATAAKAKEEQNRRKAQERQRYPHRWIILDYFSINCFGMIAENPNKYTGAARMMPPHLCPCVGADLWMDAALVSIENETDIALSIKVITCVINSKHLSERMLQTRTH